SSSVMFKPNSLRSPELWFVLQVTPISITRFVAHGHSSVEHSDPRSIGAWACHNDVALIRRIWMRAGIPIRDLVLTVVPRIRDHAINMLPRIAQLRLQCQFSGDINEAHRLVRRRLFNTFTK